MTVLFLIIGIWLMIGIVNFHQLPTDLKDKSNILSTSIFLLLSPAIAIVEFIKQISN